MRKIWFGVCLLLIGCSPDELATATIPAILADLPITRTASIATVSASPSPTPIPPTLTSTPPSTSTPQPTHIPAPTRTPTPSPWLVEDFSPFFFYTQNASIFMLWPDEISRFVTRGEVLPFGQPWSPDGVRFIFGSQVDPPHTWSLSVANLQTGEVSLLEFLPETEVYWSPDGKYLLYTAAGESETLLLMLYEFERQESKVIFEIPLVNPGVTILVTGWSPDSQQVAFVTQIDNQYDLFTLSINSLELRQLTNTVETETHVAWSPVTNQLLVGVTEYSRPFNNYPYDAQELYLIDDTGNVLKRLKESALITTASWSLDGTQIAYSDNGQLCILTVSDLSSECPLENDLPATDYGAAFNESAAWSPDGHWLAFQASPREQSECWTFYLLDLRTGMVIDPKVPSCYSTPIYWFPSAN